MGGLSPPVTAGQQREVVLTFLSITSKPAFVEAFTVSEKEKRRPVFRQISELNQPIRRPCSH